MKIYRQKGDFIRFVCVTIAAALDQMNKMTDDSIAKKENNVSFCFFFREMIAL